MLALQKPSCCGFQDLTLSAGYKQTTSAYNTKSGLAAIEAGFRRTRKPLAGGKAGPANQQ